MNYVGIDHHRQRYKEKRKVEREPLKGSVLFAFGVIDFAGRPEVDYQSGQVAGFVGRSRDMPDASRTGRSIFFSAWITTPPSMPWVPETINFNSSCHESR